MNKKMTTEEKHKFKTEQRELVEESAEINRLIEKHYNINLVTCGACGEIFSHKIGKEELTCPYCKYKDDRCYFPDLFY